MNSTFYGPSIPPPPKTYHRHGRSGGGCCCNPFSCCCECLVNCICTCLCQIMCTILVVVGLILLILWFVFRPNIVKFYATNASLTEFNLNNATLHYNLVVDLTIRNPNRRIGIYYDQIEARAFYLGQKFAAVQLQPFYQGHKTTSNLTAEFKGQNLVMLGSDQVSDYSKDKSSGTYHIDVKLYLQTRFKFWFVKMIRQKPKLSCDLKVPLSSNGTASANYQSTRCDFAWR